MKALYLIITVVTVLGIPITALAAVWTDKPDYTPGSVVTISGDNSNFTTGGYLPGETVKVTVIQPVLPDPLTCSGVADASGAWSCQLTLDISMAAVGTYTYTSLGLTSGTTESSTFTDAPAAVNLDQCRNGTAASPNDCKDFGGNTGWVNGNVGASQAHMLEGYSTPFRAVMTNIPINTAITLVIGYDIRNGGANAYDYLTTYQNLDPHTYFGHPAETVYPTDGVTGLSSKTTTYPIPTPNSIGSPAQPATNFNSTTSIAKVMTLFGGTISNVQYVVQGDLTASQSETRIAVTFKADNSTAVLAWGGHIAQCSVWGTGTAGKCNSAGGISGSPYHMRLIEWTPNLPNLGNTDRSMAAAVVVQPGNLTLAKALTGGPAGFTGPFTIDYNCGIGYAGSVTINAGSSQTINGIPAGSVCTISETLPTPPDGYSFGTPTFSPSNTVTIGQGTTVSVTTNNTLTRDQGYLKISKAFDPKTSGFTGTFAIVYNCGAGDVTVNLAAGGNTTVGPFPTGASCTVSEPTLPTAPAGWAFGTPTVTGSPATITKGDQAAAIAVSVTNTITHDQGYLKISKVFDPLTSGFTGTFAIVYNCGASDQTVNLAAGTSTTVGPFDTGTSCTVSEPTLPTAPTGWTFGTPSVSPAQPVTINSTTVPVEVSVTNTITRDQGYLKISKVFDPLTSGFAGTFAVVYNCGAGDVTVNLAAGASTTVGPFNTGTSCTVSEPTLPTSPAGWTFGVPSVSGSPATIVKGDQAAAVEVDVTNSITRDQGYLKISKVFDPLTSGFNGTFSIVYNCGAGDQTVNVAAGTSTTVGPFDTGTSCTVSEPTLPTAPTGWTFGVPSVSGSPATIVKGDQAAAVAVSVANTITRDQGYLKISKVFEPLTSGFTGKFDIVYNCGAADVTVPLAAGEFRTVGPFDTGTVCTVSEPTLPTAPAGWTFGTPTVTGSPVTIVKGDATAAVAVSVTNSITRDQGYLKISKVFDALTSGFTGTFAVVYNCGAGDVTVNLAAGASTTVGPFDTGTSCVVSEPTLPTAPTGWTFGAPSVSGSPAIIVKGDQAAGVAVTMTNSITRDRGNLKLTKSLVGGPVGYTGPFTIHYDCGTGFIGDATVAAGSSETISGIPTGTSCTISETLPTPPAGYAFGVPAFSPSAIVTIAEKDVTVEVTTTNKMGQDLTVTKTAIPTFTRTWDWTITKDFDATYNLFAGGSVIHDYKVTVTPTPVDSGWQVIGLITINNPNIWEDITANVADTVDNGGICKVYDAGNEVTSVTVPMGGSKSLNYICTWASKPASYTGTNTATVTWDQAQYATPNNSASGPMGFTFGIDPLHGNPTEINPVITVGDNNLTNMTWSADRAYAEWTYPKEFACSTDPSAYTNGTYSYSLTNTATINETGAKDTAKVNVNCYAPVVSKTAAGTYDERHEWNVEKTVNPTLQSAFAGDTVSYEWTVVVTEQTFEENFKVAGSITVVNPAPTAMTVDLVDALGGGTPGIIGACTNGDFVNGKLTIPANTTATCPYAAAPTGRTDTINNVTATLNSIPFPASAPFGWTANVIRGSVSLGDNQNPAFPLSITDGGTWKYTEQYTCSTDKTQYDATTHKYTFGESNTATVKDGTTTLDSSTVSTVVDCYVPVISKTAAGKYDEVHDWTLNKTVDPTSQNAFAGETKDFTWTVTVGHNQHDANLIVTGTIIVANPNPEDALTVALADQLNDGSIATITGCTGGTWAFPDLTVPAGGTATCDYSTIPTGRYNLDALAAALPDTVTMSVSYPTPGGSAYFPVTTITNGGALNGTHEGWCVDTDHVIYENTNYTAKVYSSYEQLPAGLVAHPENFPLVNWIINQEFVGKNAGGTLGNYTYSDVQYAIWTLVAPYTSTSGLYDLNYTRAAQIVAAAQANGVGFMPTCGDMVAVVLQPVSGAQVITIAQVTFASLGVNCADTNVATAVLNGVSFPASAKILWTSNPINPTATLTDLQGPLNKTLTGGEVFTIPDSYTCSADPKAYTNGFYAYTEDNTANLSTVTVPATAETKVNCYAPVVTKTAETYWNRKWDWTITKDYDGSYNLFAGDTVTHGYKVAVNPTKTDNFWGVKGTITVTNANPMAAMTLTSLTDLAGGIAGNVTCSSLVVPANGKLECTYDTGAKTAPNANPFGNLNTATAVFAGANWTGDKAIAFSVTPTIEDKPVVNVTDDNLTGTSWSANRAAGEWTYTKDFACSTNPADYTDGKYSYSLTNTATINETGAKDTAKVDVTCYWPQVKLTKTGDALSKIGDGVTYSIKLENNTPTAPALRDLSCTISDATIGFSKTVTLASGASDTSTKAFTIPAGASDPFLNTASVTCSPLNSTFSVSNSSTWSTNLFQPAVEIVKTGPATATSGDVITYTFTINNKSSSDSPNLMLDSVFDDKLFDLKAAALAVGCDNLVYNGTCTFTKEFTVPPVGLQPYYHKNVVTVHYHPAGFPNDITDTDDHTVVFVPRSQLTDTMWCPLPNDQFRLLYRLQTAPNTYLLNGSNPGQFYYNAFYYGTPGSAFTMTIVVPYPFMTQEGAGTPIQVHDGTQLSTSGCYQPNPMLSGYNITTQAMEPVSSAGNQIVTPDDYATKQLGQTTTVTVSGVVPSTGMAYVTIHLDYGLKKTSPWKPPATPTSTLNPVTNTMIPDLQNLTGFGSGPITIHGFEVYNFSRTVGTDTSTSNPSSYNEIKKFAGFLGFVDTKASEQGKGNVKVQIFSPTGALLTTILTDEDGYYLFLYKHTSKSATYTVKLPDYNRSFSVIVKANGFAAVDFTLP